MNSIQIHSRKEIIKTEAKRSGVQSTVVIHEYPRMVGILFLLMSAYLAVPIIDVPMIGLSLSAPIIVIISMQVFLKPTEPWFSRFKGWIFLAGSIFAGIFVSMIVNGLRSGGAKVDQDSWIWLGRYAFWLLTFLVTGYFASRGKMLEKTAGVLGWAIFGLGMARLYEAFVLGKVGAWTNPRFLDQNSYGILFSTFFPFLLAPIITSRGLHRLFPIFRFIVTGYAILLNGSRGSWVSVAAGVLIFAVLYTMASPKRIGWSIFIVSISAMILLVLQFAPTRVASVVSERFATFQTLDEEKSYMIRQVMIQKGINLFEDSPIVGVGVSRFTKETTNLILPRILTYGTQSHFNTRSAHNSYIGLLAETGLLGAIPFALLILILGVRGYLSSHRLAQHHQVWALSVFTSLIGMTMHLWTINSLTSTNTWFVYGLVVAMISFDVKSHQEERGWD